MRISGFFAMAALALAMAGPAAATDSVIVASDQGWLAQNGTAGGGNNYIAGNCGVRDCGVGEYRNFFIFDLPTLDGLATDATLRLNSHLVTLLQGASLTYTVTSTAALTFADLGSGDVFGSRIYTGADGAQFRDIVLNGAALSAIGSGGGQFRISGRVTSPTTFSPTAQDHFVFGASSSLAELLVSTDATAAPVPEPAAWALVIAGFGLAGAHLRRRRRVTA